MNYLSLFSFFVLISLTIINCKSIRSVNEEDSRGIELEELESDFEPDEFEERASAANKMIVEATFYSREEVKDNLPASGVRGSTLKQALVGYGLLQVSVDSKV